MFIISEETPNPAVLKFLPGLAVAGTRAGVRVQRADDAQTWPPLAQRLFAQLPEISALYFGADFVAVTKTDGDWTVLRPFVLEAIGDLQAAGVPLLPDADAVPVDPTHRGDPHLVAQIESVLETYVRPAVAMDGGDISLDRFEDGVAYVHMKGACAGCPSATATLRNGVANTLRHYVPAVLDVQPA